MSYKSIKPAIDKLINSTLASTLIAGLYTALVFIVVISTFSVRERLANFGIKNHWFAYIFLLFAVGYTKHEFGYYLTVESNYCKQTRICQDQAQEVPLRVDNVEEKMKKQVGFLQNVWLEAFGEGLVFVLIGIPFFLFVKPQILAAFLVGCLAHLVSSYSGFHSYFCNNSCSLYLQV